MPLTPPTGLTLAEIAAVERFARATGVGPVFRFRPVCHGFANGCGCPGCHGQHDLIAEHREAGRHPFTRDGEVKARPAEQAPAQPWMPKAA